MKDAIRDKVKSKIDEILPVIKEIRHYIHQEPEVGLATKATRQKIMAVLRHTSLAFREPLMEADVIADLTGNAPHAICLRADTDALPVQEQTGLAYQSRIPGVMHACGHDGHTAILVGTALVLDSLRELLPVSVRFVFQPGEEMICGGKTLVSLGACAETIAAYALHNWPGLPTGHVSVKPGPLFAAAAMFSITLTGRGCHGAMPEQGINPIPAAACIIERLQKLHTIKNPAEGSVISVCSVNSGDSRNIIPNSAVIQGTTRYLSTDAGDRIESDIREIVRQSLANTGINTQIEYERNYYLPVLNTMDGFNRIYKIVENQLPEGYRHILEQPSMVCEDFAFYLEGRGGAMFLLGNGENSAALHNPKYDFNDEILETGILLMSLLALNH